MTAVLAAALTFTLPRFRVPMQWVRYESGEYKAFACVLLIQSKTPWMLKQEER